MRQSGRKRWRARQRRKKRETRIAQALGDPEALRQMGALFMQQMLFTGTKRMAAQVTGLVWTEAGVAHELVRSARATHTMTMQIFGIEPPPDAALTSFWETRCGQLVPHMTQEPPGVSGEVSCMTCIARRGEIDG